MSEAVCLALLTADKVITENNGKKGIIGVFSNFNSHSVPVVFPPWYIYASVTNIKGKYNFSINLIHDESSHVLVSQGGEIDCREYKQNIDIILQISTVFPKFGLYTVQFNINGSEILSRKLHLLEIPSRKKETKK